MKTNFKLLVILSLLIPMVGCDDDLLDLAPISEVGANGFYNNDDEVEAAVVAIYDGLQNIPIREFALTEMRSDNTRTKSSEGEWAQFESFGVRPTNGAVSDHWAFNYNVIFRANVVLENLEVVANSSKRTQFEGEAKFTRALAHFNLVRAFGDVPLLDKTIDATESEYFDRDTSEDVYAFIVEDLTDASTMLPGKSDMDPGRATSGAAQALLAKVQLTLGAYDVAKTLLDDLISGTEYSLMDNFADVFYSEMNDEIIFAIPYIDDDSEESQDFSFEMTAGGVRSGLNYLTDDFIAAIDPADTERIPVLRNPRNVAEVGKFLTQSADVRLCGNDWIILRLADVYLMRAEAILAGAPETTNLTAVQSYNAIRSRVGLPELAEDGSATLTLDMLMNERRMELAFENHRLYDLVRTGQAASVLGAFATTEGYTFSNTDLLLPIPQREINVSNGSLAQNPGY